MQVLPYYRAHSGQGCFSENLRFYGVPSMRFPKDRCLSQASCFCPVFTPIFFVRRAAGGWGLGGNRRNKAKAWDMVCFALSTFMSFASTNPDGGRAARQRDGGDKRRCLRAALPDQGAKQRLESERWQTAVFGQLWVWARPQNKSQKTLRRIPDRQRGDKALAPMPLHVSL